MKELQKLLVTDWNVKPEESDEWWQMQDVDPDAVTKFCEAQAADDIQRLTMYVLVGLVPKEEVPMASIATAYEIGMIFGVKLEQARVANGLH